MTVVLTGNDLTIEQVIAVARNNEKVEIHPDAMERIRTCRAMLEKKIEAGEIMYGVNTGIGEFSEIVLNDDQVKACDASISEIIEQSETTFKEFLDNCPNR